MTEERANAIYDLLVEFGAGESMRRSFVYHHCKEEKEMCREWRFQGVFGFGGKYYSREHRISYYKEDWTDELDVKRELLNEKLNAI